jgi:hypothetical protein
MASKSAMSATRMSDAMSDCKMDHARSISPEKRAGRSTAYVRGVTAPRDHAILGMYVRKFMYMNNPVYVLLLAQTRQVSCS